MLNVWSKKRSINYLTIFIFILFLFLAVFSQSDLSAIVAEPKSTIEETMNKGSALKRQKINSCGSQDTCTTPKKQCKLII